MVPQCPSFAGTFRIAHTWIPCGTVADLTADGDLARNSRHPFFNYPVGLELTATWGYHRLIRKAYRLSIQYTSILS